MATRKVANGPVEPKIVYASSAAAVTGLVLWLLGTYVFEGGVPEPLAAAIIFFVPGLVAYAAGWVKTTPVGTLHARQADAVERQASGRRADMS